MIFYFYFLIALKHCLDTQEGVQVTETEFGVDDGKYCRSFILIGAATEAAQPKNIIRNQSTLPSAWLGVANLHTASFCL